MDKRLPARWIQISGLILLFGAAIFWVVTGRQSALFVSAAMTLILLGAYRGVIEQFQRKNEDTEKNGGA